MTKAKRVRYTIEFKLEAGRMVRSGQSLAVVSKVLGVSDQTLHDWVKLDKNGQLNGPGSKAVSPEQMEITRLRPELSRVKTKRDIAMGWTPPPTPASMCQSGSVTSTT